MLMLQTEDRRPEFDGSRVTTYSQHLEAVERVIQTMRTQLCEPLSLEDMADIACLSPYYFSRVFHQVIGLPPGEFLAALRLNAAKRLLLTTSLSVTDICFEVGYVGLGSFTTRFTQLVGVPPRHLRYLARNVAASSPTALEDGKAKPVLPPFPGSLSGSIQTITPFQGVIFAGLFPKPLPQGNPVRCTMLLAPGPYQIDAIPDGIYYLMVAAFPASEDPHVYLLPDDNVLVGVQGPLIVQGDTMTEPVDVVLRPYRSTDPPIICALPYI